MWRDIHGNGGSCSFQQFEWVFLLFLGQCVCVARMLDRISVALQIHVLLRSWKLTDELLDFTHTSLFLWSFADYPNYHEDPAYCEWKIEAPAGYNVLLQIDDVDFYNLCYANSLWVYDSGCYPCHHSHNWTISEAVNCRCYMTQTHLEKWILSLRQQNTVSFFRHSWFRTSAGLVLLHGAGDRSYSLQWKVVDGHHEIQSNLQPRKQRVSRFLQIRSVSLQFTLPSAIP